MSKTLHSERLTLRPVSSADEFDFFPLCSDERAMRYMSTPFHSTSEQSITWINEKISKVGAHFWAMFLAGGERPIGFVNYLGDSPIPGMGYIVHPAHWGHGYAPEACRAALDYGFDQLGFDRVELWIDDTNAASHRVAQKLGFKIKGRVPWKFSHQTTYRFMLVYGMLAGEWRADSGTTDKPPTKIFRAEPVLLVADVSQAVQYYKEKLGFRIDYAYGDPPVHAAVSRGEWTGSGATIRLSQTTSDQAPSPSGMLYLFTDTSLDKLYNEYRQRGVEIISEPQDRPWGLREFSIRDLNGHLLIYATY